MFPVSLLSFVIEIAEMLKAIFLMHNDYNFSGNLSMVSRGFPIVIKVNHTETCNERDKKKHYN
jgi:hypothetical protein